MSKFKPSGHEFMLYPDSRVYSEYFNCQIKKKICGNKSNSVDTFVIFILAGKAASPQLQLFTSKPKSNLTTAALCSFKSLTDTTLQQL